MKRFHLLDAVLNLFEGDGAASGAGDTTASSADAAQGKKSGDLSKVKYGKQDVGTPTEASTTASAPAAGETIDTPEARAKEFDELINGRLKGEFDQKVQALIDRRYAKSKAAEAENVQLRDIASKIAQKYGINDLSDLSKLTAAIDNDDDLYAKAAEENGMTVDQYKHVSELERTKAAYDAMQENDRRERMRQAQVGKWMNEANALKEVYPSFDLKQALSNPAFADLLSRGIDMRMAYEGANHTLLMGQAAATAAQTTEKRVVDNIRAKGKRPAENGTSSNSAPVTVKEDVSKLTKADREEIARRVMNGDRSIKF